MRHFRILILLAVMFASKTVQAQTITQHLYSTYIDKYVTFDPAEFVTDLKYYSARHVKDSLFLKINNDKALQRVIDAHLGNKLIGIEIEKSDATDLRSCIALLKACPNLEYLKLSQAGFLNPTQLPPYSLPDNIAELQQIKGIELYVPRNLMISDAFQKIALLKNLIFLNTQNAYNAELPDWHLLPGLKVVAASSDQLSKLTGLKEFKWEKLILTGNAPKGTNDSVVLSRLKEMLQLKSLSLKYFNISDLKPLSALNTVTDLQLSFLENKSNENLFERLSLLTNLRSLKIIYLKDSTQRIISISKLKKLRALTLTSMASLVKYPNDINAIAGLTQLRDLDLSSNQLTSLRAVDFNSYKQLETLKLTENQLTELPAPILQLTELKALNISSNQIAALPDINNPNSKLEILDAQYNALKALPNGITRLHKLRKINVSSNTINTLPANGWEKIALLENADFATNALSYYPGGLEKLQGLKTLNLSDNQLKSIPDFDAQPYQLTFLKLSGNLLEHLPAHIGELSELKDLYADGNNLADLPESLGNCTQLKFLDCHTQGDLVSYDAAKKGMAKYTMVRNAIKKSNHIKSLPAGLANDAALEVLNLAGNDGIDQKSIFDVILSMRRPYFSVDISSDGITNLPASQSWSTLAFEQLNLNNNKLTTLPVEFASIFKFDNITINNNPLKADPAIGKVSIHTPADMKLLCDEIGVPITDNRVTNTQYCIALTKRVSELYYQKKWQKAVLFADRAYGLDSVAYNKTCQFDEIGTCRFKLNDYAGAIRDFKKFGAKEEKTFVHMGSALDAGEYYESQAYLALHQPVKAAETHIYYARKHNSQTGYQEAAALYYSLGNKVRGKQLIDTALINYNRRYGNYSANNYKDPAFVLDYAELLIIADAPAHSVKVITEQEAILQQPKYAATKNYLLTTAKYLSKPAAYAQLKNDLIASTAITGKVTDWSYDLFNSWLTKSGKSAEVINNVLGLQNIVK